MPRSLNSSARTSTALRTSLRSGRSSSVKSASISSRLRGRPAASSAPSTMFFSSFFFSGFMRRLLTVHVDLDLIQVHFMGSRGGLHVDLSEGLRLHQLDERLLDELQQRQESHHHPEPPLFRSK